MTKNVKSTMDQQTIQCGNGQLHLWSLPDYQAQLDAGISKREVEQKAIRSKLIELGIEQPLTYLESGQPVFAGNEGLFISISHSGPVMAVYLSDHPVGVDVEFQRSGITKGSHYFVNQEEEKETQALEDFHLIWGAKEAIFKEQAGAIEDLKNEVTILVGSRSDSALQGRFKNQKKDLFYYIFDTLYVVYTS